MGYQMVFANHYMTPTDGVKTKQETAGVLAKERETAGVLANENKDVKQFTQECDMSQVAYATKPKGVGGNLDIGRSVDTSADSAGNLAADTSASSAGVVACSSTTNSSTTTS